MDDLDHLATIVVDPLSQSPTRQTSDVPNTRSLPSDAVTPVKASPLPVFSSPPEATRQPLPTSSALVPFSHNFDTPDFCKRRANRSAISSQSSSLPSLPPLAAPDPASGSFCAIQSYRPLTTPSFHLGSSESDASSTASFYRQSLEPPFQECSSDRDLFSDIESDRVVLDSPVASS